MSMIRGFFKRTKHQRFEYKPRFWNPNKEDLHSRVRAAKGEAENDPEAIKSRISKSLRRSYKSSHRSARSSSRKSTIMLLLIIVALVAISYYLLTVYLPRIEEILNY